MSSVAVGKVFQGRPGRVGLRWGSPILGRHRTRRFSSRPSRSFPLSWLLVPIAANLVHPRRLPASDVSRSSQLYTDTRYDE